MYGHIPLVLKSYIVEHYGGDMWIQISSRAKFPINFEETSIFEEELVQKLLSKSAEFTKMKIDELLENIGETYLFHIRRSCYRRLVENMGSNILEFVKNIDSVHFYVRNRFPGLVIPSFSSDSDSVSDRLVLHYHSHKKGYESLVTGIIRAAAKHLYRMELTVDIMSITNEPFEDGKGTRQHAVYNVIAKKFVDKVEAPTFIAQTKRQAEQQILQEDVEIVKHKLEEIKKNYGEHALPVARAKSVKTKWRTLAKMSILHKGFMAAYPEKLVISPRMFIELFPYHMIISPEMSVQQSGMKLQQIIPGIRNRNIPFTEFFDLIYPTQIEMTYENMKKHSHSPFVLEIRKEEIKSELKQVSSFCLKGQMFPMRDQPYVIFICSPYVHNWNELEMRHITLSDIPMWDATRDLILSSSSFGEKKNSLYQSNDDDGLCASISSDPDTNPNDDYYHGINDSNSQSVSTYCLLPKSVESYLRRGNHLDGAEYRDVTALFCDVVQFQDVVTQCSPTESIKVLNALHTRFARITRLHQTDRVETIGDAYMVICGVPERVKTHAERIANTALGMIAEAKTVSSPVTGECIQVRIGIHTGSLVCGVIGQRVPKFVALGETAIVASKMESHGIPGKIHLSPTAFKALRNKGFLLEARGNITFRGYGKMKTYILLGSKNVTEAQLTGRENNDDAPMTLTPFSLAETPVSERRNRVCPAEDASISDVNFRPKSRESGHPLFSYPVDKTSSPIINVIPAP